MSIAFIPNQPVYFVEDGTNPEDLPGRGQFDYSIPVKIGAGDRSYAQIKIAPVSGTPNTIEDPSFFTTTYWSTTGTGVVTYGKATIGDGSIGSIDRDLTGSIIPGKNYQLKVTITALFGKVRFYDGTTFIGEVFGPGTHIISYTAEFESIHAKVNESTSYVEIDNISIYVLPEDYTFAILDKNFSPVIIYDFLTNNDLFTIKNDTLTFYVDWDETELPEGCYYIGITDPESNLCNQFGLYNHDFTIGNDTDGVESIPGWSGNDPLKVVFNTDPNAQILSNGGESNYIESNRVKLCAGKTYNVTVSAKRDILTAHIKLTVGAVSTAEQAVTLDTYSDFNFIITPLTDDYLHIVNENLTAFPYTLFINDVTLELADISDWVFESKTPHFFNYTNINSETTKVFALFNNEDGLGFIFNGSNFFPQLRIKAKFINRDYKSRVVAKENDRGAKTKPFGQTRVARVFKIERQPNYIHDFINLSTINDYVYVDNVLWYVENEDYKVDYADDLDNFGPAELKLSVTQQLIRNINSGEQLGPPTGDGFLTIPADLGSSLQIEITDPSTGIFVTTKR
jgi:hypothetical protein